MTSNDDKTLRVDFDPSMVDYPLEINIVDNRGYRTLIYLRQDSIEPLLACLSHPMSPSVRLITMTCDINVKWWSSDEVAFVNYAKHIASVLATNEAIELVTMIRHEISRTSSVVESDPLAGAKKRTNNNLRGVFV